MRWVRVSDDAIESSDGRFRVNRIGGRYEAWDRGSKQDVEAIAAHTAAQHRDAGRKREAEALEADIRKRAGKRLLGVFASGEEARNACEETARAA